jgi:tetratricopeptide (TPR) repeat protein
MEFKAAKCPNCGGELQLPDNRETVKCMYCGGEVVVQKAIRDYAPQVNIDNLLELAETAGIAGNYTEAIQYFSRVLEFDPKNYKSWFGKGLATAYLADYNSFDLDEAITYFYNATENAPNEKHEELKYQIGMAINNLCLEILRMVLKEGNLVFTPAQKSLLTKISTYFILASKFCPTEIATYENAILSIKGSLDFDQDEEYYQSYNEVIKTLTKNAISNIPDLDLAQNETFLEVKAQSYLVKSSLPEPKSQPCYIATAVYGDFNAPPVLTLRHYRDEALINTKLGRLFVKFYYTLSPSIVRWMEGKSHINLCVKRILDKVVQAIESRHEL